jgi:ferric enterobactin receptor
LGLAAENFLTNGMAFRTALNYLPFNQVYQQNICNSSIRATFSYKLGRLNAAPPKKSRSAKNDDIIE